jgi:hypothetical protein
MAAYSLQEMMDYVRLHMDLDADELPNSLLTAWAREASIKIARNKPRWPFLEWSTNFAIVSGQADYSIAAITDGVYEVDDIVSIMRANVKLMWIGRDEAERRFLGAGSNTGNPYYFSEWGDTLTLWPSPTADETAVLRAYRKPLNWTVDGASSVPDFPEDFSDSIRLYMLACAYLQQEDTELASAFFQSYSEEVDRLRKVYGETPPPGPFILNGGTRNLRVQGRLMYPFE